MKKWPHVKEEEGLAEEGNRWTMMTPTTTKGAAGLVEVEESQEEKEPKHCC
jgi:hypothetical protein